MAKIKSIYSSWPNFTGRKELDLRKEIDRFLDGAVDEIKKGQIGYIRRVRRDKENEQIRCVCRNKQTDEPSRDSYCRFCLGVGFLWDERKMLYYKNEDSFSESKGYVFYIRYDKDISFGDYIVEINNDKEGDMQYPVERKSLFKVTKAHQYKSDEGRLEFWKVQAIREREWSVYYGVKNRQY